MKPEFLQTLRAIKAAYQSQPFYQRLFFRIVTFPFYLWSWSVSKNPATIDPDKMTMQDVKKLNYFFKHCWPPFFRNAYGMKALFEASRLYQECIAVPNEQPSYQAQVDSAPSPLAIASLLAQAPPISPIASGENTQDASLTRRETMAVSADALLSQFFSEHPYSDAIRRRVHQNFNKLSLASNTKNTSPVFQLIGALLMINERDCIDKADALIRANEPQSAADHHIVSARLKAHSVIELGVGSCSGSNVSHHPNAIWLPFNQALLDSLSEEERKNLSQPLVFERIIVSVLIPDTLMMGMHPLQSSVLQDRKAIAFNPRVEFVDFSWNQDFKRYKGTLAREILEDFNRRTFNLDYSDNDGEFHKFIVEHNQQYQRILFDFASLCSVDTGLFYLQKALQPKCMIYTQEGSDIFSIDQKQRYISQKDARIVGKLHAAACRTVAEMRPEDQWFVSHANNSHPSRTSQAFYSYQRTDEEFDWAAIQRRKEHILEARVAKARAKLNDSAYDGNIERVIDALISSDTNRCQASEAIKKALAMPLVLAGQDEEGSEISEAALRKSPLC